MIDRLRIAAQVMRRVLVDYTRRRKAAKRDGITSDPLTLSGMPDPRGAQDIEGLALHEALNDLAALDPRQAQIVELRYFGGLTVDEIAKSEAISRATVKRAHDGETMVTAPYAAAAAPPGRSSLVRTRIHASGRLATSEGPHR
jgi:RNA polymerase sigma factor (TIGR02999 family)